MTEYFRITGRNLIPFDALATGAADDRYHLKRPQTGMDEPMTEAEVRAVLPRLPQKIRGHALQHGLSKITFPFTIKGSSDPDMEDARHDLTETLEDGNRYIQTKGTMGNLAVLQSKSDNAVAQSYKTIFYGEAMELGGRAVLGAPLKEHWLENLQMVLYCQPYWRPEEAVNFATLTPVFNHDDADVGHNNYLDIPIFTIPGDVPAKTRIRITDVDDIHAQFFLVARRASGIAGSFGHWIEAEAGVKTNWPQVADPLRSAGNVVIDAAANAAGSVMHTIVANLPHYRGRHRVYAALWTDNLADTSFRFSWSWRLGKVIYNKWKWLGKVSTWQLVDLGTIEFSPDLYPLGNSIVSSNLYIEYQKGAGDTCKYDYLMLLPENESVMELDGGDMIAQPTGYDAIEADGLAEFPNSYMIESATGDFFALATRKGDFITLQHREPNRLYFKALSVATGGDPFSQHRDYIVNNGAPATRFHVTIDYLPQYISPLE